MNETLRKSVPDLCAFVCASTRIDGFFNLDLQSLGLWQGGGLNGHLEYRGDNMQNFRGGAILPVNSGTMLPLNSGN